MTFTLSTASSRSAAKAIARLFGDVLPMRAFTRKLANRDVIHNYVFWPRGTRRHWGAIAMTDIEDATPEAPDHHSDATIAPFWILLLALIAAIEIGALPVTRSLIAALFR